jgi:hypothetical protein
LLALSASTLKFYSFKSFIWLIANLGTWANLKPANLRSERDNIW